MKTLAHRKCSQIVFLFLVFIFFQSIINAQDVLVEEQPAENWLIEYGIPSEPRMYFRYENYSKDDTFKFREKLKSINESEIKSEWEGIYYISSGETGFSQFRWNSKAGFINFYIDTCYPELQQINYGSVLETPDYVELVSEKMNGSAGKVDVSRYIKVRWGKDFYLVEESSIKAFMEKAVGVFVETKEPSEDDYAKWSNFMVNGDEKLPFTGLPEVSANYKRFQRSPIEANILTVGKRTVETGKSLGETIHGGETAFQTVTIDAGKNKKVKVGMKFDIPETKEEIVITRVNQNSSIGLVARDVDDNKKDVCRDYIDDEYKEIACPQIKSSFKVKTQLGKFYLY